MNRGSSDKAARNAREIGVWQRRVIGLAASVLLLGGVLFESMLHAILGVFNYFDLGWYGFSRWSAVLLIAGMSFGVAAVYPPKGVLRVFLLAAGIPVIVLAALFVVAFGGSVVICACD